MLDKYKIKAGDLVWVNFNTVLSDFFKNNINVSLKNTRSCMFFNETSQIHEKYLLCLIIKHVDDENPENCCYDLVLSGTGVKLSVNEFRFDNSLLPLEPISDKIVFVLLLEQTLSCLYKTLKFECKNLLKRRSKK